MPTPRQQLATKAKIGTMEIWVQLIKGNRPRRLVRYPGVKVDGEKLEDIGEGARTETWEAYLDEFEFARLEALRKEANVQTVVHPLYGTFQARIADLAHEITPRHGLKATITLVEDGFPAADRAEAVLGEAEPASARQKARAAKSVYDDLDFDDLELPADLVSSQETFEESWAAFDQTIADVESGATTPDSLSGAYVDLGASVEDVLRDWEAAEVLDGDLLLYDLEDVLLELMDAARLAVEASLVTSTTWTSFEARAALSLPELVADWFGDVDDATLDLVLDYNPELIDLMAIDVGTQIVLPVA